MEFVRLNIGALTVSDANGGSYTFLLSREKGGKFLRITLSRAEANTMLSVLGYKRGVPPILMVFSSNLQNFGIRLHQVNVIVTGRKKEYAAELVFAAAETESRSVASFADGVMLARLSGAPLFMEEELFEKHAVSAESEEKKIKRELKEALAKENYELAEGLERELKKLLDELERRLGGDKGKAPEKTAGKTTKKAAGKTSGKTTGKAAGKKDGGSADGKTTEKRKPKDK